MFQFKKDRSKGFCSFKRYGDQTAQGYLSVNSQYYSECVQSMSRNRHLIWWGNNDGRSHECTLPPLHHLFNSKWAALDVISTVCVCVCVRARGSEGGGADRLPRNTVNKLLLRKFSGGNFEMEGSVKVWLDETESKSGKWSFIHFSAQPRGSGRSSSSAARTVTSG